MIFLFCLFCSFFLHAAESKNNIYRFSHDHQEKAIQLCSYNLGDISDYASMLRAKNISEKNKIKYLRDYPEYKNILLAHLACEATCDVILLQNVGPIKSSGLIGTVISENKKTGLEPYLLVGARAEKKAHKQRLEQELDFAPLEEESEIYDSVILLKKTAFTMKKIKSISMNFKFKKYFTPGVFAQHNYSKKIFYILSVHVPEVALGKFREGDKQEVKHAQDSANFMANIGKKAIHNTMSYKENNLPVAKIIIGGNIGCDFYKLREIRKNYKIKILDNNHFEHMQNLGYSVGNPSNITYLNPNNNRDLVGLRHDYFFVKNIIKLERGQSYWGFAGLHRLSRRKSMSGYFPLVRIGIGFDKHKINISNHALIISNLSVK